MNKKYMYLLSGIVVIPQAVSGFHLKSGVHADEVGLFLAAILVGSLLIRKTLKIKNNS